MEMKPRQPAISVGSVTSLEPSQTVLNCSGTGYSLCRITGKLTVNATVKQQLHTGKILRTTGLTHLQRQQCPYPRHSHIPHLVESARSSQSSWHWRCHSGGSPCWGRPGSPPSCWWKWWELFPTPVEGHLVFTCVAQFAPNLKKQETTDSNDVQRPKNPPDFRYMFIYQIDNWPLSPLQPICSVNVFLTCNWIPLELMISTIPTTFSKTKPSFLQLSGGIQPTLRRSESEIMT